MSDKTWDDVILDRIVRDNRRRLENLENQLSHADKTPLYLEDLEALLEESWLGPWRHELRRIIQAIRPATPEPKFKKDDWVVNEADSGKVTGVPMRIVKSWIPAIAHDLPDARSLYMYEMETDDPAARCDLGAWEFQLAAIPPKPEKIQPGFDLTGNVEVADGTKPYVVIHGLHSGIVVDDGAAATTSSCGGRRWIAKRNTKCTECGQEMPK